VVEGRVFHNLQLGVDHDRRQIYIYFAYGKIDYLFLWFQIKGDQRNKRIDLYSAPRSIFASGRCRNDNALRADRSRLFFFFQTAPASWLLRFGLSFIRPGSWWWRSPRVPRSTDLSEDIPY
jgi:hypothetical protein